MATGCLSAGGVGKFSARKEFLALLRLDVLLTSQ